MTILDVGVGDHFHQVEGRRLYLDKPLTPPEWALMRSVQREAGDPKYVFRVVVNDDWTAFVDIFLQDDKGFRYAVGPDSNRRVACSRVHVDMKAVAA